MATLAGRSLWQYITSDDVPAVASLLRNGVINLDERDEYGQTFLMIASQLGNADVVQLLLEEGGNVDVDAKDSDDWTALLNAAKAGHQSTVCLLADGDANLEHRDLGGWTALMWACYKGHVDVVEELLKRNANPNVKGEHHMSCLTWAAGRGHAAIVRALLSNGAKVNTADKYGTTPLIWAARKGHTEIAEMLLTRGANVDSSGMNSWTPLLVAARGGYTETVRIILQWSPNVNAVDKDGFTALTMAAKDGHMNIVHQLLHRDAYVNIVDRYGDSILIHAVKGGHYEAVKALLHKYADLDTVGTEHKTALYWSVEKNHANITRLLLDNNASPDIATKDGDTALLKAVRNRSLEHAQLLGEKGAKFTAVDKRGDTALHIAVRGRSKRIAEYLLRNPKHGRMQYKPNKAGETPYMIDSQYERSMLTQVYGARNLNSDDSVKGYDVYSCTIADVLSQPSLNTPLTLGLYAKWGSGKSILIGRLIKEMKTFTQHNMEPKFAFSVLQFFLCFLLALLVGLILGFTLQWYIGLGVGGGVFLLQYLFLLAVYLAASRRNWQWSNKMSTYLARKLRSLYLLLHVLFCHQPKAQNKSSVAVRFLFTENQRLSTVAGEKSIAAMIGMLYEALEHEYGVTVARLYKVFKPKKAEEHSRFKTLCCLPYFLIVVIVALCMIAMATLLVMFGVDDFNNDEYRTVAIVLITLGGVIAVAFLANIYTAWLVVVNLLLPAKKRVSKIAENVASIKMEGFMQSLKKEVQMMGDMSQCMDAFLGTHTRLVVIVDGLDTCEQERILQFMDTVHMLFNDQGSPFITILAVDPHVIIKGIEQSLQGLFRDSSITGHDYLRNIVQLPFFLQSQGLSGPRHEPSQASNAVTTNNNQNLLSVASHQVQQTQGSSSNLYSNSNKRLRSGNSTGSTTFGSTNLSRQHSAFDLDKNLGKNNYFSDVNPKNVRRLVNIIAVTGRLLRAHNIDFNWFKLASWINMTEQWPYRLSWIILEVEDNNDTVEDSMSLKAVYDRVSGKIPSSKEMDPLLEIDRNQRKLEVFLANHSPTLAVSDLRCFMKCTINVDPYLRKLIRELQQNVENLNTEFSMIPAGAAGTSGYEVLPPSGHVWGTAHGTRQRHCSSRSHHSHHEISPRGTPTRPLSSMRMVMMPGISGPVMVPSDPLLFGHHGSCTHSLQSSHSGAFQPSTAPRINVQGGLQNEVLSLMTVEDVCQLLERVEGISTNNIQRYQTCMHQNNLSGQVLLNCDLSELKPVMQMSFGDWELFRVLVQALREREITHEAMERHDHISQTPDFLKNTPRDVTKFTQQAPCESTRLEMPEPQYPAESSSYGKMTSSSNQVSSSNDSDGVDGFVERQLAKRYKPRHTKKSTRTRTGGEGVEGRKAMSRVDSVVGEVMMESQALMGFMRATGIPSQSDDSDEDTINIMTPVQEETSPKTLFVGHSPIKEIPTPQHREGDTSDSDPEAMAILCSKAERRLSSASVSKKSLSNSRTSVQDAGSEKSSKGFGHDASIEQSHSARTVKEKNYHSLKLHLRKTKSREKELESEGLLRQPCPASEGPDSVASSLALSQHDLEASYPDLFQMGNEDNTEITPGSSHEHLALRKLASNDTTPSAFRLVTPSSSRASSRASSWAASSYGRGVMSRESSVEAIRLHISESEDAKAEDKKQPTGDAAAAAAKDDREPLLYQQPNAKTQKRSKPVDII